MKSFFLLSLIMMNSAFAEIKNTGDEDVLSHVEIKLNQIEERLKDHRLFVSPAVFNWTELNEFKADLMFVVAHDPSGPAVKDTPDELSPSKLTQKLRVSFDKLEASAYEIGALVKSEEWTLFKTDVEQFFKYREEFMYVPARSMIKSGELTAKLGLVKNAAANILKVSDKSQNISVRVIDPVIEGLSSELNHMNVAVRQLQDFRKPRPVEVTTIFQEKNKVELGVLAGAIFALAVLGTVFVQWVSSKFKKAPAPAPVATNSNGFNYNAWLSRLEGSLKTFKVNEDKVTEDHIILKNYGHALSEARKKLNLSDNQQDFYASLEELNATALPIETYFEKLNVKKNAEISRRMISQVVQLCDALEANQEIVMTEQGKMREKVDPEVVDLRIA
jgi:hypothetical protein